MGLLSGEKILSFKNRICFTWEVKSIAIPYRTVYSFPEFYSLKNACIFQPITHVVAKNLVGQLNIQKPVILSMALKDNSPKTVKAIAQIIPTLW